MTDEQIKRLRELEAKATDYGEFAAFARMWLNKSNLPFNRILIDSLSVAFSDAWKHREAKLLAEHDHTLKVLSSCNETLESVKTENSVLLDEIVRLRKVEAAARELGHAVMVYAGNRNTGTCDSIQSAERKMVQLAADFRAALEGK